MMNENYILTAADPKDKKSIFSAKIVNSTFKTSQEVALKFMVYWLKNIIPLTDMPSDVKLFEMTENLRCKGVAIYKSYVFELTEEDED